MARPPRGFPYCAGPYEHRRKFRIIVYTGRRSDGRRTRYLRSFDTADAATRWRRSFESVKAAGGRTVGEAMSEYRAHLERKGNKSGSIATSGYRLDAILDASMALIDLTPRRAQQLYDDLVDEGAAVDTHRGCLIAAKAFGRFCHERSWITANPFAKVEPVGKRKKRKKQMRTDDARTFFRFCIARWNEAKDRRAIAAVLPLMLDLRTSEVAQLRATDVDDRGRLLHVGSESAKTEDSVRDLRLPAVLVPIMLELAAAPATPDGHLFAKVSGEPADRYWVADHGQRMMRRAGVKVITMHGLRGTHASEAVRQGQTAEAVAKAMGHAGTAVTKGHYIDPSAAAEARIDQVVADLMDGEQNPDD